MCYLPYLRQPWPSTTRSPCTRRCLLPSPTGVINSWNISFIKAPHWSSRVAALVVYIYCVVFHQSWEQKLVSFPSLMSNSLLLKNIIKLASCYRGVTSISGERSSAHLAFSLHSRSATPGKIPVEIADRPVSVDVNLHENRRKWKEIRLGTEIHN